MTFLKLFFVNNEILQRGNVKLKQKKLLNDPNNVRREVMKGLLYAYSGQIKVVEEYCAVYRESISYEQVIIVSGGAVVMNLRLLVLSEKVALMHVR